MVRGGKWGVAVVLIGILIATIPLGWQARPARAAADTTTTMVPPPSSLRQAIGGGATAATGCRSTCRSVATWRYPPARETRGHGVPRPIESIAWQAPLSCHGGQTGAIV